MLPCLFGKPDPQDKKVITNVAGKVRGHANGLINFGNAAPTGTSNPGRETQQRPSPQEQAQAVQLLAGAVAMLDGNSNGNSAGDNVPAGTNKFRALTNVDGDVRGTGNGGINCGELTYDNNPVEDTKKRCCI